MSKKEKNHCPYCYEIVTVKYGKYRHKRTNKQKYICRNCGAVSAFPLKGVKRKSSKAR